jgi:beta-lactam-binding protein with PASTA domain
VRASAAAPALVAALLLTGCGTTGSAGPTGHVRAATVPRVVGEPLVQANAALASAGFSVQAAIVRGRPPRNAVVSQDPSAGTRSHRGATVQVGVSDGVAR